MRQALLTLVCWAKPDLAGVRELAHQPCDVGSSGQNRDRIIVDTHRPKSRAALHSTTTLSLKDRSCTESKRFTAAARLSPGPDLPGSEQGSKCTVQADARPRGPASPKRNVVSGLCLVASTMYDLCSAICSHGPRRGLWIKRNPHKSYILCRRALNMLHLFDNDGIEAEFGP